MAACSAGPRRYHPDRNPDCGQECEDKFKVRGRCWRCCWGWAPCFVLGSALSVQLNPNDICNATSSGSEGHVLAVAPPACLQEVAHAYEILMDAEKRKLYDQFGEAGVNGQGGPGGPGGGPGGFHFQVGAPVWGAGEERGGGCRARPAAAASEPWRAVCSEAGQPGRACRQAGLGGQCCPLPSCQYLACNGPHTCRSTATRSTFLRPCLAAWAAVGLAGLSGRAGLGARAWSAAGRPGPGSAPGIALMKLFVGGAVTRALPATSAAGCIQGARQARDTHSCLAPSQASSACASSSTRAAAAASTRALAAAAWAAASPGALGSAAWAAAASLAAAWEAWAAGRGAGGRTCTTTTATCRCAAHDVYAALRCACCAQCAALLPHLRAGCMRSRMQRVLMHEGERVGQLVLGQRLPCRQMALHHIEEDQRSRGMGS